MDWSPSMLSAVLASSSLGIAGAVATYLLTGLGGLGLRRALPYACFFLAAIAIAKFQWHIVFDEDRSGLVQYYFEAIVLVPIVSVVGILSSLKYLRADRLLLSITSMTILLGLLQLLYEIGVFPVGVLNLYARVYAVVGMSLPFIALGRTRYAQRSSGPTL